EVSLPVETQLTTPLEPKPIGPAALAGRRWSPIFAVAAIIFAIFTLSASYFMWSRVRSRTQPSGERLMLAVLPFENLTGDAAQDYLSDGLTEEMIAQLGHLDPERLGVIARTSVMHYKH